MSTHDPTTTPAIDTDTVDTIADATALVPDHRLRSPAVPTTLEELAALHTTGAIKVLDARATVLETARKRGIRMTHPDDWTLFQTKTGRVTGFLSDAGCQRAIGILGVESFNVADPEKFVSADGKTFMYVQQGDGRSTITGAVVERIEGGRSSDERVFKDDRGHVLDLKVRKACRANLEGNIARRLMGLKNVPVAAITDAWTGTDKSVDDCAKGAGFGTQDERHGATREGHPDVPAPTCPFCPPVNGHPVGLRYRPAKDGRAAFYGCPNYATHPNQKAIVNADDWIAKHTPATPASTAPTTGATP